MREIKFRGKSLVTGEWLFGSLINNAFFQSNNGSPIPYILDTDKFEYDSFEDIAYQLDEFEVLAETVGQYTGLDDKNGREIYVGDILEEIGTDVYRYIVHWNVTNATYDFVDIITDETFHGDDIHFEKSEVIGNIYENPDLVGDHDGH